MQITDKFEIVPVAEINPDERNARKRSDEQIKRYGRMVAAEVAHHIVPITERPDLAYCLGNGVALCRKCHSNRYPEKDGRH